MVKSLDVKKISAIAIFSALACVLYCVPGLQFSLPFAPSFMSVHLDEIAVLISGFAYGPLVGFFVLLVKSLIKLPMDINNYCIGVLADFFYGLFFVLPCSIYYKKHRNLKGAIIGLSISFLANVFVSSVIGLYTIFQLYKIVYGDFVLNSFRAFDSSITSLTSPKIIYEFLLPFNLVRAGIVSAVTLLIYKPLKSLINRNYN